MKKKIITLLALVLLLTLVITGTVAFLATRTNSVTNTFTPSHVTTAVVEDTTTTPGTKSYVKIENTGDTSAYIRATYVVNWVDANGNIYAAQPEKGNDYTVVLNIGDKDGQWTTGTDGYYYCKTDIAPDGLTPVLINSIAPVDGTAPTGYTLQVTIIAEGIQSQGMGADDAQDAFAIAAGNTTE